MENGKQGCGMSLDFSEIVDDFVKKYSVPRRRVIAEIEKTFSIMFSRWFRMEVIALYSLGRLNFFGYVKSQGCYVQRDIMTKKQKQKGLNTLKRLIEQNMMKMASCEEYHLHRNAVKMGWGTIFKIVPGAKLLVQMELDGGIDVFAECPLASIGVYERLNGAFVIGKKRAFGVKAITPVTLNGTSRVRIELSRTVKQLPAMLLMQQVDDRLARIRCVKRFAGNKSFIISNRFIPKSLIREVENELHEHIQVNYDRENQKNRKS
jgi:hypothetical protein